MALFGHRPTRAEQTQKYEDLTSRKRTAIALNKNALAELKVAAALDNIADAFKGAGRNG